MSHKGPTSRRALRCSKDSPTTSLMRRPTAFACRLPNLNKKLCRCQQLFYSLTFTAFHCSFIWIITHNSPVNLPYWWWMIHIYIIIVASPVFPTTTSLFHLAISAENTTRWAPSSCPLFVWRASCRCSCGTPTMPWCMGEDQKAPCNGKMTSVLWVMIAVKPRKDNIYIYMYDQ